jgi:hypothetical protein
MLSVSRTSSTKQIFLRIQPEQLTLGCPVRYPKYQSRKYGTSYQPCHNPCPEEDGMDEPLERLAIFDWGAIPRRS